MSFNTPIVIHCQTTAEMRKEGYYGTTWLFSKSADSRNVNVRYSTCSPVDQFSKKNGRLLALVSTPVAVPKFDLIFYVNSRHNHTGKYVLPTVEQLFQAVVKMSY